MLIDNYSRWPEVAMVTSTSFQQLQGKLENSFSIHGIPESITHDNGPCYNSAYWRTFSRKWGFEARASTPENPKANGIAEIQEGIGKHSAHGNSRGARSKVGGKKKDAQPQEHTTPLHRQNASRDNDKETDHNKGAKNDEANTGKGGQRGQGTGWKDKGGEESKIQ